MGHDKSKVTPQCQTLEVFDALERVNAAIVEAKSSDEMLSAVLEEMLDIFSCERAWLLYPCVLEAEWFQVPVERARPDFPGAGATMEKVPMDKSVSSVYEIVLADGGAVAFDDTSHSMESVGIVADQFHIKSQLVMAIHPKGDKAWMLGIHHCREGVIYGDASALFQAIGRRVADALTMIIATQELRQSEERFRTLVERAPEAILIFDVNRSCFVEANPNAEKLFGIARDELLKTAPLSSSTEYQGGAKKFSEEIMGHIEAAVAGEFPCFDWDQINSSGDRIYCEIRIALLPHPTQTLVRVSITDISERRRAAEERKELQSRLVQSQKMEAIGNLTGGIAHDFNNLLTVVLGNLDLLERAPSSPEFVKNRLGNIRLAADRATALTHRLLAFARRQPLRPTTVDMRKLLDRMAELLRPTLGEAIEIETIVSDDIGGCIADVAQLESAILNLAINARDAMPKGGRLRIEARNVHLDSEYAAGHDELREGPYVQIAATDNGEGMSPEMIEEIFAPFFTTKGPGKGTGLGLSMVYGFVRQSNGHIETESSLGNGTTMKLYLPRSTDAADSTKLASTNSDEVIILGKRQNILVVEDDSSVRQLTRLLLNELGYETCGATNTEEALQLLRTDPSIQLLLTDVVLADGTNGAELASLAKKDWPDLHVLFMSGYSENAITEDGKIPSHLHLLAKPFTKGRLALRVREAMGLDRG